MITDTNWLQYKYYSQIFLELIKKNFHTYMFTEARIFKNLFKFKVASPDANYYNSMITQNTR